MEELDKALGICVTGPLKQQALDEFAGHMAAWGITMPSVEPLVLDFGLRDLDGVGLIEYWVANECDAGYCAKFLFVRDRQSCPMHLHREKMETFFVVKGKAWMHYKGKVWLMSEGDTLSVQTNQIHGFTGQGPCLLLEVSKPCHIDDNFFEDRRIPIGGNHRRLH